MNEILIVAPYYWPALNGGGGQVSIENLVSKINNRFRVTILCNHSSISKSNGLGFLNNKNNVEIIYFETLYFFKLWVFLKKKKFKIVYLNSFFSPLCIFANLIFIFNNHTAKIISPKGELYEGALKQNKIVKSIWLLLYRLFFKRNIFHATSAQELLMLNRKFPNSIIKLARDIPSNIENSEFIRYDEGIFKIIFCSSIVPKKNIEFLISILQNVNSFVILDIWGQAFDTNYLEGIICKLDKLPQNIKWKYNGALPFSESKSIFKAYDLFLFPTLGENYGHVIYESLSCGCPVLLSKGTTPWEDLDLYGIGYNIPLVQKDSWVDKVNFFINMSNSDRLIQRKKCIKYINEAFNIESILEENYNLFNI